MSYTEGIFHLSIPASASPSSLTSGADIGSFACMEGFEVRRIMLYVTTQATVTAPVITFYKRTAVGVTANQVAIGTLTVPLTAVAGSVIYKNLDSAIFVQGNCLAYTVTTTATAGAGIVGIGAYQEAEDPQNVAACIASV